MVFKTNSSKSSDIIRNVSKQTAPTDSTEGRCTWPHGWPPHLLGTGLYKCSGHKSIPSNWSSRDEGRRLYLKSDNTALELGELHTVNVQVTFGEHTVVQPAVFEAGIVILSFSPMEKLITLLLGINQLEEQIIGNSGTPQGTVWEPAI